MFRSYLIDEVSNLAMEDAFRNIPLYSKETIRIACSEKLEKVIERCTQRNQATAEVLRTTGSARFEYSRRKI
jgi:uridine phosphorylase